MSKKDVMIVTGAGQLSMAIARRVGYGKKIVMGDKNINNATLTQKTRLDYCFRLCSLRYRFLIRHLSTV